MLPSGSVDELLKDVPKLKAILMYHVVPGKFTVDEIGQMKTAKTVQGQEIQIDGSKWHFHMNPVINNDAHIVNADVVTENGIVHVVEQSAYAKYGANLRRGWHGLHDQTSYG